MELGVNRLTTEKRNDRSLNIDAVSTIEILEIINSEDKAVALSVEKELKSIADAVDLIEAKLKDGGRLIYIGAGTSGRLGVLDAVECRPTYGVDDELIQGIIAGGQQAMFKAKEGAEDSEQLCIEDLQRVCFNEKDILVGVAASGRTPYVLSGFRYAKSIGASVISITCNKEAEMSKLADIKIEIVVGPEVVTGSTRMKAGTAQKMVLNMLSTGVMIKLGKVYGNLMVDVRPTNKKLLERARNIVCEATGVTKEAAVSTLEESGYDVKLAIFILLTHLSQDEAKKLLERSDGHIVESLRMLEQSK